jgi:ABC-type transport system involved in cytochrome c biogenesis permease subunit
VLVHPSDPNTVWVAAVGRLFGPNAERGVYKTTDGGRTWNRVLYVDENTGATELIIHPRDPNLLYAAMYTRRRTSWGFASGGDKNGIYRSTDGGGTWSMVTGNGLPRGVTGRIALVPLVIALGLTIWGITERCIINERPPVATLYETILFITAVSALVALLLERVLRNGAALVLTGFIGALGLFLSNRFMALDGQDTMPTLEAVLITNFWLATHVTSINIGYAGAMLASILSMVVLGYRVVARGPEAVEKRRLLTRITYGVVCFGLLFSLVGTVLGGIWANDSWGRFWGWDPKENGALMIVLIGLVILHARLGGYIKETGLHVLSVLMGMITLFSWFGVNQLGVGLHSYGFTDGIWRALLISWGIQAVFMLLGIGQWAVEKWSGRAKGKLAAPAKAV